MQVFRSAYVVGGLSLQENSTRIKLVGN